MPSRRPDVVFVLPPGGQTPYFGEHLGTAFLRTLLDRAGIPSLQYVPGRNVGLATFAAFLREQRPPLVGFTAYESNLRGCRALAAVVREVLPETVLLAGGPNATFTPEETLDLLGADVCLRGAGEASIVDLVSALVGAPSPRGRLDAILSRIPSLVVRTADGIARTALGDLSSFPAARFHHLDELPSPYRAGMIHGPDVGLITSRGCNQHCTYCSFAAISARHVHYHSVERVLDDLTALAEIASRSDRWSGQLSINDDAFTLSPARARRICEGMIERGLRLRLICETRVDRVDLELLRLMRRAGFVGVAFGVESAVPHVLRAIGKVQDPHTTDDPGFERERAWVDHVRRAVRDAKRAGLEPTVSIIGGLPGETAKDLAATVAFVRSLGVREYAHNELSLLPGTPLFATRHQHGLQAGRDPRSGRWLTRHAFDVRSVPRLRGSVQSAKAIHDARQITEALCGYARPELRSEDSAWAVVLHDRDPDDEVAAWVSTVLAVHGTVVVTSTRRRLEQGDLHAWLAALQRARAPWGLVAVMSRSRSRAPVEVFHALSNGGAVHEVRIADSWRAAGKGLASDSLGQCRVPLWLASRAGAPPPRRRVHPIELPTPQIADACRWSGDQRCARPGVLHVWPEGRVTACWGGPTLGTVGDGYPALAARGLELTRAAGAHGTNCPITGEVVGRTQIAPLEVASMFAWTLELAVSSNLGGDAWPESPGAASFRVATRRSRGDRRRARTGGRPQRRR